MEYLFTLRKYLKYHLSAGTAHDIHSPFVFELLNDVIRDEKLYYGFDVIESLRAKLLLDHSTIHVSDFGTGFVSRNEKISRIATKSLKSKKYARLLFRLANHFKPQFILELGTSFGITTLYLSLVSKNNKIVTLEGCPEIAERANQHFKRLKRENITLLTGEFDQTLPQALSDCSRLDLVFFDGNHRKDATLRYFEKCLTYSHENSLFIFDDIHWSREMNEAWEIIRKNPEISISIDLFQLGLVFFRRGIKKQDFILKF